MKEYMINLSSSPLVRTPRNIAHYGKIKLDRLIRVQIPTKKRGEDLSSI